MWLKRLAILAVQMVLVAVSMWCAKSALGTVRLSPCIWDTEAACLADRSVAGVWVAAAVATLYYAFGLCMKYFED